MAVGTLFRVFYFFEKTDNRWLKRSMETEHIPAGGRGTAHPSVGDIETEHPSVDTEKVILLRFFTPNFSKIVRCFPGLVISCLRRNAVTKTTSLE
jgi:hypothetical protein